MTSPPELTLACLLSRRKLSSAAINKANTIIAHGVDWEKFISHVRFHRLQRPISDTVAAQFSHTVSTDIKNRLKTLSIRNLRKALKYCHGVIRLEEKFRENAIPVLFYKGVCLSQLLYNDPCTRYAGDIDIRIPKSHIKTAEKVLIDNGFRRIVPLPEICEISLQKFIQTNSNAIYISSDKIVVELHWRFCMVKKMFPASFKTLWQTKQYVSIHGRDIPTLSDYYTAITLSHHGSNHAWERLFWLKDMTDFYTTRPLADMPLFWGAADGKIVSKLSGETFYLMYHWYEIPLPCRFKMRVSDRIAVLLGLKAVHAIHNGQNPLIRLVLLECHRLILYNRQNLLLYIWKRLIIRYYKTEMGLDKRSEFLTLFTQGISKK